MFRGLMFGALAFGAAFAAERRFGSLTKDLKRYDTIRAMSGDPPFLREVFKHLAKSASEYRLSRGGDPRAMVTSVLGDVKRYMTMRSM